MVLIQESRMNKGHTGDM